MSKEGKKKGGCLKKILIGLGVIIVLSIIIGIFSGEETGTTSATSSEEKDTEKATEETTPEKTEEETEPVYQIGEAFEQGDLEITVSEYEIRDRVGGDFYEEKASEGAILVCLQYKFKNISDEPISISPTITLVDENDVEYDEDFGKTTAYAGEIEDYDEKILS